MSADEFIYCPDCGSANIQHDDFFFEEDAEEDGAGRECCECGWAGDESELVCKSDDDDDTE